MKKTIACLSDIHGYLPSINKVDGVFIAGDISPLDIQQDVYMMDEWFEHVFYDWLKSLPCEKVFLVGGNHDYWLMYKNILGVNKILEEHGLLDKVIYLSDNLYNWDGIEICGTPWCEGPYNWAFSPNNKLSLEDIHKKYQILPDCHILLTHQPPLGKVGCSYPNTRKERSFGSQTLKEVLESKNIEMMICGHIHSGIHDGEKIGNTMVYNVSLFDEDYKEAYPVTYLNIDKSSKNFDISKLS